MNPLVPLLPGAVGWCPDLPCPFDPERAGNFREERRTLPAAIRLFSTTGFTPKMAEKECFASIRNLSVPSIRRGIRNARPTKKNRPNTRKMLMWIYIHPEATDWWRSQWAWRSPREIPGWRRVEYDLEAPHIEPYELARLRLPEDVILDADVILLQAWCQGVTSRWIAKLEDYDLGGQTITKALLVGLRKLHSSPWFKFLLASHHLQPVGVTFPRCNFSTSTLRMDAILRDPYSATDAELEVVLGSYTYKLGYAKAASFRSHGQYMSPPGPWYSVGSPDCLGKYFRRGGAHGAVDLMEDPDGQEEEG